MAGSKSSNKTAVHLVVRGRVQGVGFRSWTASVAKSLRVAGTAQNLSSGDVEIFASGEETGVASFIERVRNGPPRGNVDSFSEIPLTESERSQLLFMRGFTIL